MATGAGTKGKKKGAAVRKRKARDRRKKQLVNLSRKLGLQFCFGRIGRYLKKGMYARRGVAIGSPVYAAAVLEDIAADVMELARRAARRKERHEARRLGLEMDVDCF